MFLTLAQKFHKLASQILPWVVVDGYWIEWEGWEECTVSCGGGTQPRIRECIHPLHGGAECNGAHSETQPCNNQHCPGERKLTHSSSLQSMQSHIIYCLGMSDSSVLIQETYLDYMLLLDLICFDKLV